MSISYIHCQCLQPCVIPAKAGSRGCVPRGLDAHLRGHDVLLVPNVQNGHPGASKGRVLHKGEFMIKPRVVDRGDGPKIEGTRITVYTVFDYLRAGRTRDWIAALLHLSSDQVQAAMDYIRDHDTQVNAEYEAIMTRIEKGNPAQVEERLRANREKVKARLSRPQTTSR